MDGDKINIKFPIAISGKARSGKNTVAEMFVNLLQLKPEEYKIAALADPMKRIIKIMFPESSNECLFGPSDLRSNVIAGNKYIDKYGKPLTYRQALIDLGSSGRKYNSDIWLNCIAEDAKQSYSKTAYVISDVRLLNEFEYLKTTGFIMIRIIRDDCSKINDVSETEQDKIPDEEFDYIISNNSTLDKLKDSVQYIIWHLQDLV